ncbi:MAG: phosphohistidine phosphatase SixA [Rickettsiales bacterium]|nr:phosphohistidine phosphatase SixA [Rickettsiales bacterium]
MKKLYLLRHAKTEDEADSGKDVDRQLNEDGIKETIVLSKAIASKKISCDIVLCSIALRARQTCERIMSSLVVETPVKYVEDLYYVDRDSMLKSLEKLNNDCKSVLIISHNPTLGELATYLVGGEKIRFETATLKLLELNINSWLELFPSCAKLVWSIPD